MELRAVIRPDFNNPDPGDLFLDDTGDAVQSEDLALEVAQRITVRANFFRSEWFLDLNEGTPWYQHVLTKAPPDRVIRSVLRGVIADCEGVASLDQLLYSISRERTMSVDFRATLDNGTTLTSRTYGPLYIDLQDAG